MLCGFDFTLIIPWPLCLRLFLCSYEVPSDTLDPMNCSTPGFLVLHYLPEFAKTHVHWDRRAVQSSHSLSSHSPLVLSLSQLSQYRCLFQWVGSSHQVAKVLEFQHHYLQRMFRVDFLKDWLVWSPCSPRDSQECSPTPQFKGVNSSALNVFYSPTLTSIYDYWKNNSFD